MSTMKKIGRILFRIMVVMALALVTCAVCGGYYFGSQVRSVEIPDTPSSMDQAKPITFTYSDGVTILGQLQPEEGVRTVVPGERISMHMKNAIVSAEDKTFWDNYGFSARGITAAAIRHLKNDPHAGGGSGITQQLVKNTLVGDEYSLERKWNELLSSVRLTARWDKDDIISAYLNIVYFGRGALGVEEAAQSYFGVSAAELNLPQSILLAGMVQAPSEYDPILNPEDAQTRFNYVADEMVDNGFITAQERADLVFPQAREYTGKKPDVGTKGTTGLLITQALNELETNGFDRKKLHSIGATVVTTIDQHVQQVVTDNAVSAEDQHGVRIGVATIDPHTGGILASYGGRDGTGYDVAVNPQMTGSTFKLFALTAALDNGIGLDTAIDSSNYVVNGVVTQNSGGQQSGMVSLREATKQSLNTVFYRLQQMYPGGPRTTREYAQRMGVDAPLAEPDGSTAESIVLGSYGTSPQQLATGYATVASDGTRNDRHIVSRVLTSNGQQTYRADPHPTTVLDPSITRQIDQALLPIAAYSNGNQLSGKTGYMKTGTVALNNYSNRDALAVGYTDNASTAVWVGTNEAGDALVSPIEGAIWGAGLPSRLWKNIMNEVG